MFKGWRKVSNGDLPSEGEVIITVEKSEDGKAVYDLLTATSYLLGCLDGECFDPRFTFDYWGYVPLTPDLDT